MSRLTALALAACLGALPLLASRGDEKPDKQPEKKPEKAQKVEVPYRLTNTNHLLVRAKLNGKGPFNLIVDTGAPIVIVTKEVAKKAKAEPGAKDGWVDFDSFELEGGLKVEKTRARAEDITQIEGMNRLDLAGVELHGVIGYTLLARFRVEYDLTSDRLVFEPLAYEPPALVPLGLKGAGTVQSMGPLVKVMAALLGIEPNYNLLPRGFTGIEFEERDGKVLVKAVLPGSPAEKAGLKAGDHITGVKTDEIKTGTDLSKALAKAGVGTKWRFTVTRGGKDEEVVVELGKGL